MKCHPKCGKHHAPLCPAFARRAVRLASLLGHTLTPRKLTALRRTVVRAQS